MRCRRRGLDVPPVAGHDAVLLGGVVLPADLVPHAGRLLAAVGERDAGAPGEPAVAGEQHVAGDPGPHQADDRSGAVVRVHARPAGLDDRVAQRVEPVEVELALRVQPAGLAGAMRRQHPVGPDDLAGGVLADHEVVAERVETVHVEPGDRAVQTSPELVRRTRGAAAACAAATSSASVVSNREYRVAAASGVRTITSECVTRQWEPGRREPLHGCASGVRMAPW